MTFDQLKSTLLTEARTRRLLCPKFHAAQISVDVNALIQSVLSDLPHGMALARIYDVGMLTDSLLATIDQSVLNANGIYSTGTFTIANPVNAIYILGTAIVNFSTSGNNVAELHIMGTGAVNITLSDTSYCDVTLYKATTVTIGVSGNSTINLKANDSAQATITLTDNSNANASLEWFSNVYLTGNGTSLACVTATGNSKFYPTMNGDASYYFIGNRKQVIENNLT